MMDGARPGSTTVEQQRIKEFERGVRELRKAFGEACLEPGIAQTFTRAYRTQTNGKAERFIRSALREWACGRAYQRSDERRAALPAWNHFYN